MKYSKKELRKMYTANNCDGVEVYKWKTPRADRKNISCDSVEYLGKKYDGSVHELYKLTYDENGFAECDVAIMTNLSTGKMKSLTIVIE